HRPASPVASSASFVKASQRRGLPVVKRVGGGITEHILSFDFLISVIISSVFSLAPNHTSVFKQNKSL
uniref:Uncharacterized protein n=1 Tax=Amphiprion ocellaris TaxID=80972 RepID=A0A3Q1CM11_AMPOC